MRKLSTARRYARRMLATGTAVLGAAPVLAQHEQHLPVAPTPVAEAPQSEHVQHAGHASPSNEAMSVTDAEHAAAFPDLSDMRMRDMMLMDPLNKLVLLDELETRRASGDDSLNWDLDAWIGRDLGKLWVRSEGERRGTDTERAELELLWGKSVARWWDLVAGTRSDFAAGDTNGWAAVGVRGLAPYRFEVEATAYLGSGGRTAFRVETAYEVLVTNRLILEPSFDLDWSGRTDPTRAVGSGLANAELGLRLRYEVRREIAPYVGIMRERTFGRTADLVRAAGGVADDSRFVAGIRLWF
ncbi:MAG TPA: copper resistance protein B [Gammaproteobacteria bacterium]|nr:copper resistance protein B [Gammaproteobacteria bacterium]